MVFDSISVWTCAFTPLVFSVLIGSLIIGFTSRSSLLRPAAIPAEASCVYFALKNALSAPLDPKFLNNLLVFGTSLIFLAYLDAAVLSKWTFEAQGPTSSRGGQTVLRTEKDESRAKHGTVWERLNFGFDLCFRSRSAGTPWEVSNVPPFFRDQPEVVPNRGRFLYVTGKKLMFDILVLDVLQIAARYGDSSAFQPLRVFFFSRLSDVTLEEFVSRIINTIVYWNVANMFLEIYYNTAAFVVIGLGLGNIAHWPPLFGYFTQLWSMRQFWG